MTTPILQPASFSVSAHQTGGVITALDARGNVLTNMKLTTVTAWALGRAMRELAEAQHLLEREQAKQQGRRRRE
jgi:hypothetical protein